MKKLNSENKYITYAALLLLGIILPAIPYIKGIALNMPIAVSLYWCAVIGIIYFCIPAVYIKKSHASGDIVGYGLSGGVIFIALSFVPAVFMKKLEASPYDISVTGILLNIITILPQIAAKEMTRQYSFAAAYRTVKYKRTAIVFITVILSLIEINFTNLLNIKETRDLFIYCIRILLPIITKNILMSVLVFNGGALPAIVYLGIIQLFQKCFPVLPELSWLLEGAIGIVFPSIYAIFIMDHIVNERVTKGNRGKKEDIIYLVSLFLATLFAWFCVGVFPVYPSVILTGSMEPLIFPGDVVLIKKITQEKEIYDLSEGDIINFKRDNIVITHRIKKVIKDEAENVSFETKGDNNISVDEPIVMPNDIKGIVVKVVPKVGLPVLILKGQDKVPEGVIDN